MNYRILLVDDEPDILEIVRYNLKKEGYEVSTASDGVQAIEKAIKYNPHLIVMDVMMPNMDGIEAFFNRLEHLIRSNVHNGPPFKIIPFDDES